VKENQHSERRHSQPVEKVLSVSEQRSRLAWDHEQVTYTRPFAHRFPWTAQESRR
jgi:hypothetical protein